MNGVQVGDCVVAPFHISHLVKVAVENVPVGEVVLRCPQLEPIPVPRPDEEIRFHAKPGEVYYIETLTTPGILVHHVSCIYRSADWFSEHGHKGMPIVGHTNTVSSIDYREYEEWSPKS